MGNENGRSLGAIERADICYLNSTENMILIDMNMATMCNILWV